MNISCQLEKLLEAVVVAERIVGKKESLPVLSCVLFEAGKNLSVKATNLEVGVDVNVPAEVSEDGAVAVPASILLQTLQTSRGNTVSLTLEEGNMKVKTDSSESVIKTIPHDEFPAFSRPKKSETSTLSKNILIEGVQSTQYCASQSMIRPELASIYVHALDGEVYFVATDSFRLAEKKFTVSIKDDFSDLLIPTKNALELVHVLSHNEEENVEYVSDEGQLSVFIGSTYFFSRVIDGTFPNYREILPKQTTTEATLLKEDFNKVLKKTRIFSNSSGQVGFHIYPKKKIFSVTAQNADVGETSDTLEAAVTGDDIDINFNLRFIGDCLQSIHADSITLNFSGPGKPLVVKGVGDSSFTYLVMPLNK